MNSHVGKAIRGDGFPCDGSRNESLDPLEEGSQYLVVEANTD